MHRQPRPGPEVVPSCHPQDCLPKPQLAFNLRQCALAGRACAECVQDIARNRQERHHRRDPAHLPCNAARRKQPSQTGIDQRSRAAGQNHRRGRDQRQNHLAALGDGERQELACQTGSY